MHIITLECSEHAALLLYFQQNTSRIKSGALLPRQPVLILCHFTQRSRAARNVSSYTLNDAATHTRSESSAKPLWEPEISKHERKWFKFQCFTVNFSIQ